MRTWDEVGRLSRLRRLADPSTDPVDVAFDYQGMTYAGRTQTYEAVFSWEESLTTDALGRLLGTSAGPWAQPAYALDLTRSSGRVLSATWSTPAGPTLTEAYDYDDHGRLVEVARTTTAPEAPAGWTLPWTEPATALWSYERDEAIGSLARVTTPAALPQLPPATAWEAGPRSEGHRLTTVVTPQTSWAVEHDAGGRVTSAGPYSYTWDVLGRLIAVHDTEGTWLEGYAYTADGRLAGLVDEAGQLTSQFAWDGGEMVAEYTPFAGLSDGAPGSSTGGPTALYAPVWEAAWGPGTHRLVEWWRADEEAPRVAITDARRSVAGVTGPGQPTLDQLVDYGPDGAMTVADADGAMLCAQGVAPCVGPAELPFGFGTAWRSSTTGLSWMRHRWLSPALHQFLSPDPLGYIDAFDGYAYAAFDPINGWDPWGLANQGFAPSPETVALALDQARYADDPNRFLDPEGSKQLALEAYGAAVCGALGGCDVANAPVPGQAITRGPSELERVGDSVVGAILPGAGAKVLGKAMQTLTKSVGTALRRVGGALARRGQHVGAGGGKKAPFNPTGGLTNCVNGVCAFLDSVRAKTLTLAQATNNVAWNGGSVQNVLRQIRHRTGVKFGQPQLNTLNTTRSEQFFVVFEGSSLAKSNHVAVGIVKGARARIYDPQTHQLFNNPSDFGPFTAHPLIFP